MAYFNRDVRRTWRTSEATQQERQVEPYFIIIGGAVVLAGLVWRAVRKARGTGR